MEGYCGIVCDDCKNYLVGAGCKGCRKEKDMIADCDIRICCITKDISSCINCHDFPCNILKEFYPKTELRRAALQNLLSKIQ